MTGNADDSILQEFLSTRRSKGLTYFTFTVSSALFIVFFFIDGVVDLEQQRFKRIDWNFIFIMGALPVVGMMFHLLGKKIGWVINIFYYFALTCLSLVTVLKSWMNEGLHYFLHWKIAVFIPLLLVSTIVLLSNPLRSYFGIRRNLAIAMCGVCGLISVLLVVFSI